MLGLGLLGSVLFRFLLLRCSGRLRGGSGLGRSGYFRRAGRPGRARGARLGGFDDACADGQALLLRLDAALDGLISQDDDRLLVVYDLDERLAALHGQFVAVFIEEDHAAVQILRLRALAHPSAADVAAALEDFAHALAVQADHRTGGVVAGPGNIRADDDHVGIGAAFAGIRVDIGRAVAVSIVKARGLVVLIGGHIGRAGRLVADDQAVHILAAGKRLIGEKEGMDIGRRRAVREHGAHVQAHVVGRDVVFIAGTGEPTAVLGHAVEIIRMGEAAFLAVGDHPIFYVVLVPAALIAIEAVGAAPHFAQRGHRHARRADRSSGIGMLRHEQRQRARGAVRLNRQFIGDIRRGDAPVRQRARMGIDVGEHQLIFAREGLAGQRALAIEDRVFAGHVYSDLGGAIVAGLAQLLRAAADGEAAGGKVRSKRGQGQADGKQQGKKQTDQSFHDGISSFDCFDMSSSVYTDLFD